MPGFFIYFILSATSFATVGVLLVVARKILSKEKIKKSAFLKSVYRITVPQRNSEKEEKQASAIKERLDGLSRLYANLGGMKAQGGLFSWLFGRDDEWSFETVLEKDGLISFYMAVPKTLENYFIQQIMAYYPAAQLDEVEDYNIFLSRGAVAGAYLKLSKANMFPIVQYKDVEGDPLVSVLNSLAKLPKDYTAAIQIVLRSARKQWRNRGLKVVSQMYQGKNLKEAMDSVSQSGKFENMVRNTSDLAVLKKENQDIAGQNQYRMSSVDEQTAKAIGDKASKAGMDANIRIVASAPTEGEAKNILQEVINTFSQYSGFDYSNSFKSKIVKKPDKIINDFIYRRFDEKKALVLNTDELTSLWHLPLVDSPVPNIRWLQARRLPPPVNIPNVGLLLGENSYRGKITQIRIKDEDRRRHMYIIGMTGTGKSYHMANLALQDIKAGKGVCVIDPHGSLIEEYISQHIPNNRLRDVVYFNPADTELPIGLNMLDAENQQQADFAASEMIVIFYKLLSDPSMAGPMFEHYMRNALLLLMADRENPGTLVELPRVFTDKDFRAQKLKYVNDILVRDFWEREYPASQRGSTGADMLSYVISKTGKFVENEMMRNIIGQTKSGIDFRKAMDEGKILLLNLSKGKVGETNSNLLGLIAVSKLQVAAMARADMAESERKDFYLYIDEFQNFITDSISAILAEARKYRLNLIMGHQYISQLTQNNDSRIRDAVFGNVGNIISFRIGVDDSELIAKQLAPDVGQYDLLNLEKYNAYVRLLIDNTAASSFNMKTLPLPDDGNPKMLDLIKDYSRVQYGRHRDEVVRDIISRSKIGKMSDDS